LQKELTNWNKNPGPVDGQFGSQTESAVKAAQTEVKVTADGIYGPVTKAAFDEYAKSKGWGVY
jgi:peptidoglycan hydrolase-like protein with peptidoglycan-binding domain